MARPRIEELSHAELVASIVSECRKRRLWTQRTPDHPGNSPGWVDLVILGRGGALFVEVKVQDGRRTLAQVQMEREITTAGLYYRLWRPSDFAEGRVTRELDAIA